MGECPRQFCCGREWWKIDLRVDVSRCLWQVHWDPDRNGCEMTSQHQWLCSTPTDPLCSCYFQLHSHAMSLVIVTVFLPHAIENNIWFRIMYYRDSLNDEDEYNGARGKKILGSVCWYSMDVWAQRLLMTSTWTWLSELTGWWHAMKCGDVYSRSWLMHYQLHRSRTHSLANNKVTRMWSISSGLQVVVKFRFYFTLIYTPRYIESHWRREICL